MCMLNPDEYPTEKVQELYEAEAVARDAVNEMFPDKRVGDVLHQSGTAATWFVEPKDVKIVNDHLVSIAPFSETDEGPEQEWSIQVKWDVLSVNLYAGTDFVDDSLAKFQTLTSTSEDPQPNRFNRRQKNQSMELKLESAVVKAIGFHCESGETLRRRFSFWAHDFALYDRIHTSVFQYVTGKTSTTVLEQAATICYRLLSTNG